MVVLLLILSCKSTYSQSKLGSEWVTGGGGAQIKFVNNTIITSNNTFYNTYFSKGNSNICDTNGNLVVCSDGFNIYDSNGNYLQDGDTIVPVNHYIAKNGWSLYAQTSIFLPMDSNKFYFVTPAFSDARYADCQANNHCFFDLLLYNIIDMNANAGAGKVTKRMQPLMINAELSKTQMMACRHSNGKDWWLLKMGGDSNKVYKFLFQHDTVIDYGLQKFNEPVWGVWDTKGQSMFSPDGSKFATIVEGDTVRGKISIADFDRCYGILSNQYVLQSPFASCHAPPPGDSSLLDKVCTGLVFSPDGSKLYVMSQYNIFQYDFTDQSWYHVAGLDTNWQKFQLYSNAYLGPDDKLYVGNFGGTSRQMSVINNPNAKGTACDFCPRCLRLDTLAGIAYAGTPPCMPNYNLGAKECWPLENMQYAVDSKQLEVFPNPAIANIYIKSDSKEKRELYNSVGQLILSTKTNEINVRNFSRGIYYLKVENVVRKFVIE